MIMSNELFSLLRLCSWIGKGVDGIEEALMWFSYLQIGIIELIKNSDT